MIRQDNGPDEIYQDLKDIQASSPAIIDLFEREPARMENFVLRAGPIRLDLSKQRISEPGRRALLALARDKDVKPWRDKLFAGEAINSSENRAVLHPALRGGSGSGGGNAQISKQVVDMRGRMREFARSICDDGRFSAIVHIGIGGSDLGPRLVADAFAAAHKPAFELRFAENVDGASINDALDGLDPAQTLVIIVSKSFTTQETRMNGQSARSWLRASLRDAASSHIAAVTANRAGAESFGVAPDQIFDFWDWVGGRYSVWSAVGLSLQIAYGPDVFDQFLAGAAFMDGHFTDAPLEKNLPVMLALTGIWNRNVLGYGSQAVIPYARRLRKLPAFLQQLEMESNGKSAGRDGQPAGLTCPVVWGDEGTNSQHAFFQWLHQGAPGAPVDFVAALSDKEGRPEHSRALLANCFAQSEALMLGKREEVVREELAKTGMAEADIAKLAPQKTFPGNRPSSTLTLDTLSPYAVGALIALYEHKTFVQGVIWNINSFDQWGVELGKVLAKSILRELETGKSAEHDPSTRALIDLARNSGS